MVDKNSEKIYCSLIKQLMNKHAEIDVFTDLIKDYITLWNVKEALAKDIQERGVSYEEKNVKGERIYKNNPSTKDLVSVNKQMLSLLKELGLTTDNVLNDKDVNESSDL